VTIALDAAYPPSPAEWVQDLDWAGAESAFYYAVGPFARYTPAHLEAARAAGKRLCAIIVPGSAPTSIHLMLAVVAALGGAGDPVVFDLETGSLPPALWLGDAISAAREAGHPPRRYGDMGVLAGYPAADGDWVSHGPGPIRAGWSPADGVPVLRSGLLGWQFAVQVTINGHQYDVSVCDPSLFAGGLPNMRLEKDDPIVQELQQFVADVEYAVVSGDPAFSYPKAEALGILRELKAAQAKPVDVAALAAELVAQPGFVDAIGAAVVKFAATKLGS
jgi:hypothetical protein